MLGYVQAINRKKCFISQFTWLANLCVRYLYFHICNAKEENKSSIPGTYPARVPYSRDSTFVFLCSCVLSCERSEREISKLSKPGTRATKILVGLGFGIGLEYDSEYWLGFG